MSMLPLFFAENWDPMRPSRLLDQHFGVGLDTADLMAPLIHPFGALSLARAGPGYYRPWRSASAKSDAGSTVALTKDKFQVTLDVQQFAPEEVSVKVAGNNSITVEGKHEEKQDEHGYVSRHFVRRYVVPDGHDLNNVVSNLSSDGVLSITAPRAAESGEEHRTIPIQQTGTPMKVAEKKQEDEASQKE